MGDAKLKGIHLLTSLEMNNEKIAARYQETELFHIPFPKVHNTAIYNNSEIEIDIPFEDFNEQHDVLCGIRFYVPPKAAAMDEEKKGEDDNPEPNFATQLHESIKRMSKVEETVGDLICTLQDLPLVVPRGKYSADFYRNKGDSRGELKLHGSTFSYKINYKNIVKAFLLPQNDDANMNLVVGFDKPLRQGNTSYPYIIFQFKKNKLQTVEMKLPAEQLSQINSELTPSMEGDYYSIFAKLLKLIVGISIIIPGEFKTVGGHPGLKCCVGNQEGILFPLNKSLIFIKKPVILIKIDEIVRVEFHRVSDHSIRSFDFEIVLKNGITTNFSGADKRELQNITSYFDNNKVTVVTVNQNQKLEKDIGEESSDDDKLDINDDEEDDEEDDGDFVAKSDEEGSEEDGDYDGEK